MCALHMGQLGVDVAEAFCTSGFLAPYLACGGGSDVLFQGGDAVTLLAASAAVLCFQRTCGSRFTVSLSSMVPQASAARSERFVAVEAAVLALAAPLVLFVLTKACYSLLTDFALDGLPLVAYLLQPLPKRGCRSRDGPAWHFRPFLFLQILHDPFPCRNEIFYPLVRLAISMQLKRRRCRHVEGALPRYTRRKASR